MSSLLKMNQKFLSKSSWSIRGGGGGGGSGHNANNTNNNHNHHNNLIGNRIDFRMKNEGKNFSISPNSRQLNNSNSNHQSSMNNNVHNLTPNRPQFDPNRNNIKPLSSTNQNHQQQMPQSNDIYSKDTLVNNNLNKPLTMKSQNNNLKRSKGISISITDLRDLKEKPKKIGNSDNDQFEREIKERRIDTYIAEIEMDPVFQLGSTIRYFIIVCQFVEFFFPMTQMLKLFALKWSLFWFLLFMCFIGGSFLLIYLFIFSGNN